MVIGVTGKYCAGKSTVASILTDRGFVRIDVDKLGHQALEIFKKSIIDSFGNNITDNSGNIDRKKLGGIVFQSQEKLSLLESITHPWILQEINRMVTQSPEKNFLIDAAILYHTGLRLLCNGIIIVHTPFIIRFYRAMIRDNLSPATVFHRFKSQINVPDKKLIKKNKKNLNKSYQCSELLVIGTYSKTVLGRKLTQFIEGVKDGATTTQ